jgi:hypothetical protein
MSRAIIGDMNAEVGKNLTISNFCNLVFILDLTTMGQDRLNLLLTEI